MESLTIGAAHIPGFPAELGSLTELVLVHVGDEPRLAAMLRTLPVLRSLVWLCIANCALAQVPDEQGALANLEVLELSCNKPLKTLPADAIGKLSKLVVEGNGIAKLPKGLDLDHIPEVIFDEKALQRVEIN